MHINNYDFILFFKLLFHFFQNIWKFVSDFYSYNFFFGFLFINKTYVYCDDDQVAATDIHSHLYFMKIRMI